jgi:hypothetical protein
VTATSLITFVSTSFRLWIASKRRCLT